MGVCGLGSVCGLCDGNLAKFSPTLCVFILLFSRSLEEGLLPSLSYRNMSRLYATASLVELTMPPSPSSGGSERGMARLQAVCRDNKMEENLNNLAEDIDAKEYALSPGQSYLLILS